jgi:LPS export ABC transporter protein LptC
MNRKTLWILLAAMVVIFTWSRWQAGGTKSVQEEGGEGSTGALNGLEQKIMSFTIDGRSPKGVKQWHLEGNSAEIIGENIHLNDLTAIAYGEETTVNLTSDKGVYNKDKGEVELIGNVNVTSDAGFTLKTEHAKWSQVTKEIFTDEVVHITGKGVNASGKGGMANSEQKIAVLREQVMVTMEPSTRVNCDGRLEVRYDENTAVFHDNVKVVDKDGKLFSDKLTVNMDPETKKLAMVVAEGNVKVKRGNSYTMSEKAIYTDSTRHAQLIGKPRVVIDPEQLSEIEGRGE